MFEAALFFEVSEGLSEFLENHTHHETVEKVAVRAHVASHLAYLLMIYVETEGIHSELGLVLFLLGVFNVLKKKKTGGEDAEAESSGIFNFNLAGDS